MFVFEINVGSVSDILSGAKGTFTKYKSLVSDFQNQFGVDTFTESLELLKGVAVTIKSATTHFSFYLFLHRSIQNY